MSNKTHITIVADRSGSMAVTLKDAEGGLNHFIEEQKTADGECTLALWEFDTVADKVYDGDIQEFTGYKLSPRGGTALRDAIGLAINSTGAWLRLLPRDARPDIVIFMVVTDGEENSSKEFSANQIKKMITHQEEKYSWEFTFLGCGREVALQGVNLGFNAAKITVLHGTGASIFAGYSSNTASTLNLRSTGRTTYAAAVAADGTVVTGDSERTSV